MAKFKVGDKVLFHGKPAIIKEVINEPDADYILDNGFYAEDEELTAANSCRNTVVANALAANRKVARNENGVPPDLWEKLKRTSLAYVVAGGLKKGKSVDELIARFRTSGPGSQIPGRAQDSAIAASVLEEMKARGINACGTARNDETVQREVVRENIESLKGDIDKIVRGLNETKRWMSKYSDERVNEIEKAKSLVVQALSYLR